MFQTYNKYAGTEKADIQFTNQILNQHLKSANSFIIEINNNLFRFDLEINGYNYGMFSRNNITIKQGDNDSIWPA
ncbi:hypothetical protein [Spiroplasma endosymbiont of Virgichneumon dumeticola]|uniref:hypothetical protein n=1 Tax=Spiroplasma endosymbiont of Virgichneumon dumeticola TaxID=3139323 RepID=UPI0035C88A04